MEVTLNNEQDDPLPTDWLVALADVAMRAEELPGSTQLSITLVAESQMAEMGRFTVSRLRVEPLPIDELPVAARVSADRLFCTGWNGEIANS